MEIRHRACPAGGRVLIHICCAPDATHGVPALGGPHRVTGFFFNPNIHPPAEHARRLAEARRLADLFAFPLEAAPGGEAAWEEAVRSLEREPERGKRCEACIRLRLARTAGEARNRGFEAFGTVLTVSPKKDAAMVNRIGREEGAAAGIPFIEADLKKNGGFASSVAASRRLGIYRQSYCGCRYSFR